MRLRVQLRKSSECEVRATKRSLQTEAGRHRAKDMLRSREGFGEAEAPEAGRARRRREWRSAETERRQRH